MQWRKISAEDFVFAEHERIFTICTQSTTSKDSFMLTEIDRQTDTRTVLGSDFGSPLSTDIGTVWLNWTSVLMSIIVLCRSVWRQHRSVRQPHATVHSHYTTTETHTDKPCNQTERNGNVYLSLSSMNVTMSIYVTSAWFSFLLAGHKTKGFQQISIFMGISSPRTYFNI